MDEETLIDVDLETESASLVGLSTILGKQGIVNGLGYYKPLVRRALLSIFSVFIAFVVCFTICQAVRAEVGIYQQGYGRRVLGLMMMLLRSVHCSSAMTLNSTSEYCVPSSAGIYVIQTPIAMSSGVGRTVSKRRCFWFMRDVSVNFAHVVEISVRHFLAVCDLLILVE